jgi:hypothetical protein
MKEFSRETEHCAGKLIWFPLIILKIKSTTTPRLKIVANYVFAQIAPSYLQVSSDIWRAPLQASLHNRVREDEKIAESAVRVVLGKAQARTYARKVHGAEKSPVSPSPGCEDTSIVRLQQNRSMQLCGNCREI